MEFRVVIPARYASTRLPGKPLLDIGGPADDPACRGTRVRECVRPRCWSRPTTSASQRWCVDPRNRGAQIAVLTDPALASGTDRVAAVAAARGWPDSRHRRQRPGRRTVPAVAAHRSGGGDAGRGSGRIDCNSRDADRDAGRVRRSERRQGRHRSAGPRTLFQPRRDSVHAGSQPPTRRVQSSSAAPCGTSDCMRTVQAHCAASCSSRRRRSRHGRRLEQLRALQNGMAIAVALAAVVPDPGVDTEADLRRARMRVAAIG